MLTSRSCSLVYGAHGALFLTSVKLLKAIPHGYAGRLSFRGLETIQLQYYYFYIYWPQVEALAFTKILTTFQWY